MKTRILILMVLALVFTSCLTVGRIQRNCDKFAKICTVATVTKTVYRDTTIYLTDTIAVKLPADTVTITKTITVTNNVASMPPVYKSFGLIAVKAGVNNSVLNVTAWLKDSTLLQARRDTVTIKNAIRESGTTTTLEPVIKKVIPGFYKFTFWFFIILVTGGLLYAGFKLRRKIIKAVSPV